MPTFEWDGNKRRRNIAKHGLDFLDAGKHFDGRPVFTYRTVRDDEERWGTVGVLAIEGRENVYLVVWANRHERVRIIAFYRADSWEIREYHRLYG